MKPAASTLTLLAAVLMYGCSLTDNRVSSSGAPYEIYVTMTPDKWNGELGDTLRSILLEPVEMINQTEPAFDVFFVQPTGVNNLVLRHRNLMSVRTSAEYGEPQILAQYDMHATPQIVMTVTGPDDRSVTEYLDRNRDKVREHLENAQRGRFLYMAAKYNERTLEDLIRSKFDMKISVPRGYKLRSEAENFLWLSFEYPQASQGVIVYSYPYAERNDFTEGALLARRNEFTALVPGPSKGSYMTTSPEFTPTVRHLRIHGRYWAETRGFWDVENDFMGGPFVSYSTLDTQNDRVVCIDCYLFSPKRNKRNYLRELEALVYSASFSGDNLAME